MIVNTFASSPPQTFIMNNGPGAESNPIALDDENASARHKAMLQQARNKAIIQEAEITNEPMDLCIAVVKTCIEGDLFVKKRELTKAIQKYFQEKLALKISHEHFYPRPEPDYSDPDTEPKFTELVLYGVDFMTTNAIKDRLKATEAEIKEITWVNDSTCRVVCASKEEADRLLKTQVQEIKLEDEEDRLRSWFLLKPYFLYSFERTLCARYATSTETLPKQVASKYLVFAEAKSGLGPFLLKQFHAEEKYRAVVEELEAKRRPRMRSRRENRGEVKGQFHSRSRERQPVGISHQREYLQSENKREQRVNRFKRNRYEPERVQLQENRVIKYAHQPVEQESDFNYNHNIVRKRDDGERSFEYSPTHPHYKKCQDTDFHYNQGRPQSPASLDASYLFNKGRQVAVIDNISERDSEFSYHPAIFKPAEEDNRMDYHYDPIIKRNKNGGQDYSFILDPKRPKLGTKMEESGESFIGGAPLQEDSQDFFDFLEGKPKPKQSTLDTSFRHDKPIQQKPKAVNTNFFDDDSY